MVFGTRRAPNPASYLPLSLSFSRCNRPAVPASAHFSVATSNLRLHARSRSRSMATVLESLVVPRASGVHTPLPSRPAVAASIGRRKASRFTAQFSGLRVQTRAPQLTLASERRVRRIARRGIVCEAQETAVGVPSATDATWQSLVTESSVPVLVEFWAPWCGPCRMIHPVIDELSRDYAGRLKCFKVNTDECPAIATEYGIRSIPTVIVFKNGEKKDAIIGAVPKSTLTACIDKFL